MTIVQRATALLGLALMAPFVLYYLFKAASNFQEE